MTPGPPGALVVWGGLVGGSRRRARAFDVLADLDALRGRCGRVVFSAVALAQRFSQIAR